MKHPLQENDSESLYVLLQIIQNRSSVKRLIRLGYTYEQVAEMIQNAIKATFIVYKENRITLSDLGIVKLGQLALLHKKLNKDEWIDLDFKNKLLDIDNNTIFIPSESELDF